MKKQDALNILDDIMQKEKFHQKITEANKTLKTFYET
jgi:hypothetical protein